MIRIRSCQGHEELQACVQMQVDTWGYDESDVIPRKAFLVYQKIGGQVIGAFDTDLPGSAPEGDAGSLVGFAVSLPGVKPGPAQGYGCWAGIKPENGKVRPYLHSHMLAVHPDYRNRGLGAELKLEQRREALSRGIAHIEWTFDPLEIRNAHLNIHKLGAIVCCYHVNFYGVSSSRLQGGLPTDRLIAEWNLDSPRVTSILEGKPRAEFKIEERILVPASIYQWKASEEDRERASAIQLENRLKFQKAFNRGLAVLGFSRDAEGNGVFELGSPTQAEMN